jgi:hypothetical protein
MGDSITKDIFNQNPITFHTVVNKVQEGIEGSEDVLGAIDDAVQGLVE